MNIIVKESYDNLGLGVCRRADKNGVDFNIPPMHVRLLMKQSFSVQLWRYAR